MNYWTMAKKFGLNFFRSNPAIWWSLGVLASLQALIALAMVEPVGTASQVGNIAFAYQVMVTLFFVMPLISSFADTFGNHFWGDNAA